MIERILKCFLGRHKRFYKSYQLAINHNQDLQLTEPNAGILFYWGPDQQAYYSHVDKKPPKGEDIDQLIELMTNKSIRPASEASDH